MPPVEVGWGADAVVNVSRLPSLAPTRPADPLGTFQRRHSMSLAQQQQQGGEPAGGGGGRPGTDALQWTDSRKLLEAAIAIEQLTPIQEDAPAAAGWGWGAGGWGGTPLDAAEQRLQVKRGNLLPPNLLPHIGAHSTSMSLRFSLSIASRPLPLPRPASSS